MKKHQINLVTAMPYENGTRVPVTKKFVSGFEVDTNKFPKYWTQKIHHWDNLRELSEILSPYIDGTAKDSIYTAICYGVMQDIGRTYGTWYQKKIVFMEDTLHQYFILDIETDAPDYADVCLDLNKIREWLIKTYSWIQDDTGMFLYFSPSAGVITKDGKEKHKQIRVRAIMEHTCRTGLTEDLRKNILRPYMKAHTGKDFTHHIDNGSHQLWRHFNLTQPILHGTERVLGSDIRLLVEGNPIEFDGIRHGIRKLGDFITAKPKSGDGVGTSSNKNLSSDFTLDNSLVPDSPRRFDIKNKETEDWYREIGAGNRYEGHYNMLWSAYLDKNLPKWRDKLLSDKEKLGNKTPATIDSVCRYIEENHSIELEIPFEIDNHNVIDIPVYLLRDWLPEAIAWQDKGIILQKLYEGAGKTEALRELRKLYPNKTFLYMAPNIKPVDTACIDLNLTNYQGLGEEIAEASEDGVPVIRNLGLCYPSLKHFAKKVGAKTKMKNNIHYDIVVLDEIEQLLCFALENKIIKNPAQANEIIKRLVARADLVVGLDARITNLTLQCLEYWRPEETFDIYTQSKVLPFKDHHFTFVDSLQAGISKIIEAVNRGKRVAVVSELDNDNRKKYTLEALKNYVKNQTGVDGLSVDAKTVKTNPMAKDIVTKLSKGQGDDRQVGKLEELLLNKKFGHMWFSPVVQSSWSYVSEEAPFDLVVGLYPNRVLTAPNIIQHIKRFRTSNKFVMFVEQRDFKTNARKVHKLLNPEADPTFGDDLSLGEFNERYELNEVYKDVQLNNRLDHLKEIIDTRGGVYVDDSSPVTHKGVERHIKERWLELEEFLLSPRTWKLHEKLESINDV